MISQEERIKILKAGHIAGEAREYGRKLLEKDVRIVDVLDKVEDFIISKGAGIAFPAQISLNTVAAHECSDDDDDRTLQEGDVAKIDVGAHIDGFIGDTALTVNLDSQYKELLKASEKALKNASTMFRPGVAVGEIGEVIQETITDHGFSPVKNLSGHGLGQFQVHTSPSIPNIKLEDSVILEEGMTVACEPFATNGKGAIDEAGQATVFSPVRMKPVRGKFAREILESIKGFQGLPFTTRWLTRKHGKGKTLFGLKELQRSGVISSHPPLKEVGNGMVSQHEHSFIVEDKPTITTKLDDE
ncbi:MAG: type II methionyl aminopeptidase [Nanoarchaeota archaeon]